MKDDGKGFDPDAVSKAGPWWGVGLRSMREGAEMLGGRLRVALRPGTGTRVELRVCHSTGSGSVAEGWESTTILSV